METSKRPILYLDRYRSMVQPLTIWKSWSPDGIIRVRVDWNGVSSLGTFQVQNPDHGWDDVGNLSPMSPVNDAIVPMPVPSSSTVLLHLERGPAHGAIPFEAWARPIRWLQAQPTLRQLPSDTWVVREQDYEYAGNTPPSEPSSLIAGVQTVELKLDLTQGDYELWVKLRHPTEVSRWSTLDPVVGHGDRNGTPIPRTGVAQASDVNDTSANG